MEPTWRERKNAELKPLGLTVDKAQRRYGTTDVKKIMASRDAFTVTRDDESLREATTELVPRQIVHRPSGPRPATAPAPIHVVIPDTQVRPGVATDHMRWIGQYIVDKFRGHPDVTVVHLGDHWDMPSLSSFDKKGGTKMEGRRYSEDIEAGNDAFALLDAPIRRATRGAWSPRLVYLRGNHEHRITRASDENAQLAGTLSLDDCDARGWETHGFLVPVTIHGVTYSHYFYAPGNGRPYSGMIETRLKNIGRSFTQGHQQVLMYGLRPGWTPAGLPTMQHGLIAGACYLHDEDYMGPQGNGYWRGIVVCHGVEDGAYDPMFVSLDYLCRRYEGVTLRRFAPGIGTGRA